MSYLTHIIAINFELTKKRQNFQREIIEFPAVLINLRTGKIVEEFHRYVRPLNIFVSNYQKFLTGISGTDICFANSLEIVLLEFENWLKMIFKKYSLKIPKLHKFMKFHKNHINCGFVTWGNCMKNILHNECIYKNITLPKYMNYWINLQMNFKKNMHNLYYPKLNLALIQFGMQFDVGQRSGLVRSRMMGILCQRMIGSGIRMQVFNHGQH